MTRRFPALLTQLALTMTLASSCMPGALTMPNGPLTADRAQVLADAQLARDVSAREPVVPAGIATLKASPVVKTAVTEMTQSVQEYLAFEAESKAEFATLSTLSFGIMAKDDKGKPDKGDDHPSAGKGPNMAPGKPDNKGKPAPAQCPPASPAPTSDTTTTTSSDVTASPAPTESDVAASPAPTSDAGTTTCTTNPSGKMTTTTTNADGSVTKTTSRTRSLPQGGSMSELMSKTTKDGKLIAFKHVRDMTLPSGVKRHQEREQKFNADGSSTTTVTMSLIRPDGKTRSISVTTTTKADGTSTRTGTITKFDGTTVTIGTAPSGEVTVTDPATDTTVTVPVTSDGTAGAGTVTVGDTPVGTVETTPATDVSPVPEASATPAPETSAAPTASPAA